MPRFVILEHDHPQLHWDFMLEVDGALRTWRLAAPPQVGQAVAATPLGDHRLIYLDYEGPVSGDRGTVRRWDAGQFIWEENGPFRVVVRPEGQRVLGRAILEVNPAGAWWFLLQPPNHLTT